MITSEATTCRHHLEAFHEVSSLYSQIPMHWAEKNNFISKLPLAVKRRKEAAQAQDRTQQTSIDPHTVVSNPERVVPYSDKLFREAAIQWLIETNQPIQALDHPRFKERIDVAARSTHGVVIPSQKKTREYIIELFKKNLASLRDRLKVSDKPFMF
ncbi:hypothetical protein BJ165DRAFT_1583312 [Panaeolus papilionaceus]|nr:hypothetical protein BJ165DRAFT_1583312 [Panaeolus papilionaceus]